MKPAGPVSIGAKFTLVLLLALQGVFSGGCSHSPKAKVLSLEKWGARSTLAQPHYGSRRIHRMQPVVTEDLVIVGNSLDGLVAYDRKTFNSRWQLRLRGGVEAGAEWVGPYLFFAANDGHFYSLAVETGKVLWSYPIRSEGIGQATFNNGVVYFVAGNNVLHALNAEDGSQLWIYSRREASQFSIRGAARPTVEGQRVYAGFSDGSLVALDRSSGRVEWEVNLAGGNRRFRDVDAQPIIDGDRIYISSYDGALYALNISTGQILWRLEEGGFNPVTVDGNRIFYPTSNGQLLALEKSSGQKIWSQPLGSQVGTRPQLFRGLVVVGEYTGQLRVFDAQSGEPLASFDPGRGVTGLPWLDPETGEVLFVSADANLFSLRLGWRDPSPLPRWWRSF